MIEGEASVAGRCFDCCAEGRGSDEKDTQGSLAGCSWFEGIVSGLSPTASYSLHEARKIKYKLKASRRLRKSIFMKCPSEC